jgi:hypothetical protein
MHLEPMGLEVIFNDMAIPFILGNLKVNIGEILRNGSPQRILVGYLNKAFMSIPRD